MLYSGDTSVFILWRLWCVHIVAGYIELVCWVRTVVGYIEVARVCSYCERLYRGDGVRPYYCRVNRGG